MREMTREQTERIEAHKRSIGRRMFVVTNGGWYGVIDRILDEENFELILVDGRKRIVNIFDLRDPEYFA